MPLRLTDVSVPDRIAGGRNAREGYQRAWALQFSGPFREAIVEDAIFLRAFEMAHNRTVVDIARLMNLFLIIRFFLDRLPSQNIVEFGTYRGGSAMFMASCLKELFPKAHIYALDTFEGMPDTSDVDMHRRGDFADAQFAEVTSVARNANLNNITFVKGRFDETFPKVSGEAKSFGLAHIDSARLVTCFPDLAAGTAECPSDCDHLDVEMCTLDEWVAAGHAHPERLDSLRRLLIQRSTVPPVRQ